LHPETKHGGDRKSDQVANSATRFTANTADATGKSERAVQIAAARGEALGDDLGAVTGTSLDKGVELDAQLLCSLGVIPIAEAARSVARKKQRSEGHVMSLADKFHIPKPASIRNFSHGLALPQLRLLAILGIAAMIVAALAFIFAAGHPIISIWAALIIIGWLFVAGAAKVSED
jgi:hypothetical protein